MRGMNNFTVSLLHFYFTTVGLLRIFEQRNNMYSEVGLELILQKDVMLICDLTLGKFVAT